MNIIFRIVLYLAEAGFAAEAGDMEAYEQKLRIAYENAIADDSRDTPACDADLLYGRPVTDTDSEHGGLTTVNLLDNILIRPRLALPSATKRLLVETALDCRRLLCSDGRRYFEFCSQFICSADDPYRYSIEWDMSEDESAALHDQLDASYKRCPSSEYVYFIEIYRNTVERMITDGGMSGYIAYTRAAPDDMRMLYGYCNCGAKEKYKGLPIDWKNLPTQSGARVFAIMDMLIPKNFEGCGLEKKLLTYALKQAREQGFTHVECFLWEVGYLGGTEAYDRMLAIYTDMGFTLYADFSDDYGRLYILQKPL